MQVKEAIKITDSKTNPTFKIFIQMSVMSSS